MVRYRKVFLDFLQAEQARAREIHARCDVVLDQFKLLEEHGLEPYEELLQAARDMQDELSQSEARRIKLMAEFYRWLALAGGRSVDRN